MTGTITASSRGRPRSDARPRSVGGRAQSTRARVSSAEVRGWSEPSQTVGGARTVESDDDHPAVGCGDRFHPFRGRPEDQARSAQPGRLALDPARIGHDGRRMQLEREARPVAEWFDDVDRRRKLDAGPFQRRAGPRMQRQDHDPALARRIVEDPWPHRERGRFPVLGTMDRREDERTRLEGRRAGPGHPLR